MEGTGVYRINGNLAVARAIGDIDERPFVSGIFFFVFFLHFVLLFSWFVCVGVCVRVGVGMFCIVVIIQLFQPPGE